MAEACEYCGKIHEGKCFLVKAIEYHPNGTVKRVEFMTPHDMASPAISVPSVWYPSVTYGLAPQAQCNTNG